ncbi:hypothetical protein A5736_23125 [Mycobacterium sp. SP-6446]|nr:hypothetical protein A5736_23125 [Mycobacterium sp. SP-6446]
MMAWTGLHDSYGVPVADYYVSTVSPFEAGVSAAESSFSILHPETIGNAIVAAFEAALSNFAASGFIALECAVLIFIGGVGIWFVKFALAAPWLSWLATLANPFVNSLNVLTDQLYVMPIALLVCCLIGGVVALTKGMGRGLGIIGGGLLVILLVYWLMRDPVQDMISDNGILGIGQHLGFMVAEGAVHNGPLAAGGTAAQLDALDSLLCDVLLREPIQMIDFGMVVDTNPVCADAWSAAIMAGQPDGPAHAMAQCAPAALAHAQHLGLGSAGWFLVVIAVELVVMSALLYIAAHVVGIGFKTFFRVLVLVPAAPLAVAPGPTRRFAAHSANRLIIDGVEMLATTAGLGIVAIICGEVTSGSVPGLTGMSSPFAKLMMLLVLAVAGAFGYHHMLKSYRQRRNLISTLGEFGKNVQYIDYLQVTATGRSLSGWRRSRWYHDPKTSDLWPGRNSNLDPSDDQARRPQPVYIVQDPDTPGRSGHPPPNNSPTPWPQARHTSIGGTQAGRSEGTARGAAQAAATVVAPEAVIGEEIATGEFAAGAAGRRQSPDGPASGHAHPTAGPAKGDSAWPRFEGVLTPDEPGLGRSSQGGDAGRAGGPPPQGPSGAASGR